MRFPALLLAVVASAIASFWYWMGVPGRMPASPLAAGEKLGCVSYAPFRGDQSPLDPSLRVPAWQIDDDLARLAPLTHCVRTYSTRNGLDQVPQIAAKHGLKVIQGLWIGGIGEFNRQDMETTIALANRQPDVIQAIVVGNEVLLRGEMSARDLVATIRRVKAEVRQPVTYADVWEFWLRNRDIAAAVDFVTIHVLPYWEDWPVSAGGAAAHVAEKRAEAAAAFPDKEIFIGETGWPSAGRMRERALPSPANQARVLHEVLALAKRENFRVNLIEAFDQPWKRRLEGTVGGHWGLRAALRREPKFTWGEPVSNHPFWPVQAVGGIALALAIFGIALAGNAPGVHRGNWIRVALGALGAGGLIGWAVENAFAQSLGWGGMIRGGVLVALASAIPIAAATALARGTAVPTFAGTLQGGRPGDPLARLLGLLFLLVCIVAVQAALGFVFDPRYRDFPFAPLTAAALPFFLLPQQQGAGGLPRAERALAGVLGLSAVYIALNEGFANWQALWFCGVLAALVFILLRVRAAPS
jgi:exo-beta-1,3-glucanase (GH17 family)